MKKRYVVILAAGQGSRMKSKLYKVLHPVAGKPMVEHVIDQVEQINPDQIVTIVGHGAQDVKKHLKDRSVYAMQEEQLGTGHAVVQSESYLRDKDGTTLVICGDTPLLTAETLSELFKHHEENQSLATILTAKPEDASGYGRVIRGENNQVEKIVEDKDANDNEKRVNEINTGTFCFDNHSLFHALDQIDDNNAQGEFYLTDVIEIIKNDGGIVQGYQMPVFDDSLGINDRVALAKANQMMYQRINHKHLLNGVSIIDPNQTYIESDVTIGSDTVIEPGVHIKGKTSIGVECFIGANSEIIDSEIHDHVKIRQSIVESSIMHEQSDIGPFGRLRPGSELGYKVHVGNFVEIKNSKLDENTKVGHLTYVGDATLGKNINVGCGTVFVNYDGEKKHHITIGDNAFIGCNVNLIAPVNVEANTTLAAGTTITETVPENALAIGRVKQQNKEGYLLKNKKNK